MATDQHIRLKGIKISGFQGVPPNKTLELSNFGRRNVFIGQNDSGKSLPLRFLLLVIRQIKAQPKIVNKLGLGDFYSDAMWEQSTDAPVVVDLTFSTPTSTLESDLKKMCSTHLLINHGLWHFRVRISIDPGQTAGVLTMMPLVEHNDILIPTCKYDDQNRIVCIQSDGEYVDAGSSSLFKAMHDSLQTPLVNWANNCRFFDPIRAINRGGLQNDLIEDGSTLGSEMKKLKDNPATLGHFYNWEASVCQKLSKLFNPAFASLDIPTNNTEMYLKKKTQSSRSIPLKQMGTGVQQMIIAYARLVRDANYFKTYFFEEPESNLHPRLLRSFVKDIGEYDKIQFFITSHSSALLDALDSRGDRVYHFSQDSNGVCSAHEATGIIEKHAILDALGVNGGSLLQSNCVIWVEGPSDRLYIRRWLNEYAAKAGYQLREHIDYSFSLYGGSILSHYQFEATDDEVQELMSLLSINRYSAVIMDKNGRLTSSQKEIIESALHDDCHRFAAVTDEREIENDISRDAFRRALPEYLGVESEKFDNFILTSECRYTEHIPNYLSGSPELQKSMRAKLEKKVPLAQKVLEVIERDNLSLGEPTYIKGLCELIKRSCLDN